MNDLIQIMDCPGRWSPLCGELRSAVWFFGLFSTPDGLPITNDPASDVHVVMLALSPYAGVKFQII